MGRRPLRPLAIQLHRRLSLAAVALWTLQALTGLFAVFHWEIDDATVAGEHRPLSPAALERTIANLAPAGSGLDVDSLWATAGSSDRFDLSLDAEPPARGRVIRLDGEGRVLRIREAGARWSEGGWVESLVLLHQSLLAGPIGRTLVGASGLLLLLNVGLGLGAAWPRRGTLRRALLPRGRAPGAGRCFAWHRALGLWGALPVAGLVACGALLAFEETTERLLAPPPLPAPSVETAAASEEPETGFAGAVRGAIERFPAAELSGVGFPTSEHPWWTVRLKQPSELQRAYGRTRVWVSQSGGRLLAVYDPATATPARRLLDHLFALHTGEIAGLPGRLFAFALGLWLAAMSWLGLRLWWLRRSGTRTPGLEG